MHIKGGLRGQRGNPLDKADEGVFVSKINSGGAARRDGRLKVSLLNFTTKKIYIRRQEKRTIVCNAHRYIKNKNT